MRSALYCGTCEISINLSTFSLLLKKPNYKSPRRFVYRIERTKFLLILNCNTVTCRIFRGISFNNVVMTCARCGNWFDGTSSQLYLNGLTATVISVETIITCLLMGQCVAQVFEVTDVDIAHSKAH